MTTFCGSSTGGKSVKITIRATTHLDELYPNVFIFQDVKYLQDSVFHHNYDLPIKFNPLTIVKCTVWSTINGADVSAGWEGWYENV